MDIQAIQEDWDMKELRSFKDVIENLFYDEIERAISEYVAEI